MPIAAESVSPLLNSRNGPCQAKVDRIDGGLPSQLELLLRVERSRGGVIGDLEIGDDAEDALLLLLLNLRFRYFYSRSRHMHFGDGGGEF